MVGNIGEHYFCFCVCRETGVMWRSDWHIREKNIWHIRINPNADVMCANVTAIIWFFSPSTIYLPNLNTSSLRICDDKAKQFSPEISWLYIDAKFSIFILDLYGSVHETCLLSLRLIRKTLGLLSGSSGPLPLPSTDERLARRQSPPFSLLPAGQFVQRGLALDRWTCLQLNSILRTEIERLRGV